MELTFQINQRPTYRMVVDAPNITQADTTILEMLGAYGQGSNLFRVDFNHGNAVMAFERDLGVWTVVAGDESFVYDQSAFIQAVYAFASGVSKMAFGEYPFEKWEPAGSVLSAGRIQFAGHDEELRDMHKAVGRRVHYEGASMIWFDELRSQRVELIEWFGSSDATDCRWLIQTKTGRMSVPEYRLVPVNQPAYGD